MDLDVLPGERQLCQHRRCQPMPCEPKGGGWLRPRHAPCDKGRNGSVDRIGGMPREP